MGGASTFGGDKFESGGDEGEELDGVLVKNRKRCDLWAAAVSGEQGNNKYQCERAAKQQRAKIT